MTSWRGLSWRLCRARSTDRHKLTANKLTANQQFRHSDYLVTDFATVILSQSEDLGKMALEIVKYAYDCSSQLIGVIWFAVSLFAFSLSWSVVVELRPGQHSSFRKNVATIANLWQPYIGLQRPETEPKTPFLNMSASPLDELNAIMSTLNRH